jgi:hypothetical protein
MVEICGLEKAIFLVSIEDGGTNIIKLLAQPS